MKYKISRQFIPPELAKTLIREMRHQLWILPKLSKKQMAQMAKVCQEIEEKGLPDAYKCKKLPHNLGHGIFLDPKGEPIPKGTLIAPYSGDVLIVRQNESDDAAYAFNPLSDIHLTKEEQSLYDRQGKYHPRRLYALKIDAEKGGNFTRFINHSEKPNIIAYPFATPKNSFGLTVEPIEIIYFAKKTIYPGEQLLISYEAGEEDCYWGAFKIKPYPMDPKTFTLSERGQLKRKGDRSKEGGEGNANGRRTL